MAFTRLEQSGIEKLNADNGVCPDLLAIFVPDRPMQEIEL